MFAYVLIGLVVSFLLWRRYHDPIMVFLAIVSWPLWIIALSLIVFFEKIGMVVEKLFERLDDFLP